MMSAEVYTKMTPTEFLSDIQFLVLKGAPRCNYPACGKVAYWRVDERGSIPKSHLCCDAHMGPVAKKTGLHAVSLEQSAALRRVLGVLRVDA